MKPSPPSNDALEQHRRAIRINPGNAQAHAQLGVGLQQLGRFKQAVASQRRALELDPGLTGLHAVMAPALQALGEHQDAVDSYRRALLVDSDNGGLHKSLAISLRALGQLEAAAASASRAAALCPDDIDCHLHLAKVQFALRNHDAAEAALRRALELNPDNVEAHQDLADTLHQMGQYDAAIAACRRALKLGPDNFDTHIKMAASLRALEQHDTAVAIYQQALQILPDNLFALRELGLTLFAAGKVEPALASLRRALEINPDDPIGHNYLGVVLFNLAQWERSLHHHRRAVELEPDSALLFSSMLFALSHYSNDPVEVFAEHRKFGVRFEAPHRAHWGQHPNQRDPERCLQVGFVSGDLLNHAVATFIEPVFESLKHSKQVALHAYYNHVANDAVTERLRGYVAHWHPIADLDDDALEQQIRADRIDILVDLSGHSARNRLPLFARKPAPVQASWIGYGGTTGLEAMDYYLADQFHLPEGRYDEQFTEKIARVPLAAPFTPEPTAPPVNALPALANGYLTFGSFHRASKLSRNVIALWAQLLRAIPTSRLLLGGLGVGADSTVLPWFAEEGIDAARLLVQPRTGMTEYLGLHHQVDICLTPFPYTGSTTVCHALWMGVPTLATVGPTNASHAVACYLAHLGLSSFLADDDATFVNLGVFLSQNLGELAALRAGMRQRFVDSVAGYPGIVAAGVEHALRLMWRRWCADLPPAPLRVRLPDLIATETEPTA